MAIQGKKVAMFVNTQNMVEENDVIQQCRQLESVVDIFIANKCSMSLENLGIDVDAKYYDYDYVIVINPFEKAEEETQNTLVWRQKYYLNNVVSDKAYLEKQIDILENSSIEGMLVPSIDYIKSVNKELYTGWKDYYEQVEVIVKENSLEVMISNDKSPVISEGGCAIIKTSAIRGFEHLKMEVYDAEVISYVLSLYMQSNGYLPGYSMKEKYMVNNLLGYGAMNQLEVQHAYPTRKLVSEVYFDTGNSFEVSKVHSIEYVYKIGKKEKLKFKIDIPENTKYIRFDPCEGNMCFCSGIKTNIPDIKIHNFNGLRFGEEDLFLTKDPQYILEGNFSHIEKLTITIDYMSIFWSENGLKDEMDKVFQEKEELAKAVHHLTHAYQEQEEEKKQKEQDVQNVREELRSKKEELENTEEELKNTKEELQSTKEELQSTKEELQNKIINLENELQEIKGSRSWKLLSKYRSIKARVLRK